MKKIRLSLGSAGVLGLKDIKTNTKTKTVFLMNSGGCVYNCSFCAQASGSNSAEDKLSRVSWPEFETEQILKALSENQDEYHRLCLQAVNTPTIFSELPALVKKIRTMAPNKKIALSVRTQNIADIDALFEAGANEIGLSIDAMDESSFARIKGGSLKVYKDFILAVADKYPGQIATHLIVGMGESEKQAVEMMAELFNHQVIVALFAFTPVKGSRLENQNPPDINSYRRIQVALHLIRNKLAKDFTYDNSGQIVSFGYRPDELGRVLLGSNVFETSGCTDCNRPYYNERAGSADLYNYPYQLADSEILTILNKIL